MTGGGTVRRSISKWISLDRKEARGNPPSSRGALGGGVKVFTVSISIASENKIAL